MSIESIQEEELGTSNSSSLIPSPDDPMIELTEWDLKILDMIPDVTEEDEHPLEHIDDELKIQIIARCSENPHFFSYFCRSPAPEGYVAIKPYGKQKIIINEYVVSKYVIILGSRQTGKTTITYTYIIWLLLFRENYKIGILMQKDEVVKGAMAEVFEMYKLLPSWLKEEISVDNTKTKVLANKSKIIGFAIDPKNPDGVGRSLKVDWLLIDEGAFINYIDVAYRALKPVTSRRHLRLKKAGIPYGISIISTPNGMLGVGRWYYQFWTKSVMGENNFKPVKFHWREVPEYDDDWFKDATADMTQRDINQEYELKFLGSQNAFLDDDIIENLQDSRNIQDPINVVRLAVKSIQLFEEIDPEDIYLIGADPADSGDDNASMILFNYSKNRVAGIYYENSVSALEFVDDIVALMHIINKSIAIFEKNSLGSTSIQMIYREFGGSRVFVHKEHRNTKDEYKKCGISTNAHTRKLMIDLLYQYAKHHYDIIKSAILIYELIGLEQKGKRVEAGKGMHDDASMAFSFILYAIHYGEISYYVDYIGNVNNSKISENLALITQLNMNKSVDTQTKIMNQDVRYAIENKTHQIDEIDEYEYSNSVLSMIAKNNSDFVSDNSERNDVFSDIFGVN